MYNARHSIPISAEGAADLRVPESMFQDKAVLNLRVLLPDINTVNTLKVHTRTA
jgi:hypothetical protein